MTPHYVIADRGATINLPPLAGATRWLAVAHAGCLRSQCAGLSILMQVRGRSQVLAREGRFDLKPGDWLVLDRDSAPEVHADRHGVTLGVVAACDQGGRRPDLLPGAGRMSASDLRIALRLWRNGAEASDDARTSGERTIDERTAQAFHAMSQHIAALQRALDDGIARSPGRSISRKRQVFGRMQRAKLFLEGHRDRVVRLTELAELTSFSIWYLSKTYHEIYRESPQAASVRLRLERACELLAESVCSISEVGIACGFDNSCSFARAFRARYGTTASDYRQRHAEIAMIDDTSASTPTLAAHSRVESIAYAARGEPRREAHSRSHPQSRPEPRRDIAVASVLDRVARLERDAQAKVGTRSGPERTHDRTAESVIWLAS